MRLLAGTSNLQLAEVVARRLGTTITPLRVKRFSDGEVYVEILDSIRGEEVFILQSTSPPRTNDHLVELLLTISAARRASAAKITAVVPYFGYARQDRLNRNRTTISAADVATLLVSMGVDGVVTVELHAGQIAGYFGSRVSVDDLDATHLFLERLPTLMGNDFRSLAVVSPDAGGVARARKFRERCSESFGAVDASLAFIVKQRLKANEVASMQLVGDVKDRCCVLVDDLVDTAGTLLKAAKLLHDHGANCVYACIGHGVLSGPALDRLENDTMIKKMCILDTITQEPRCSVLQRSGKLEIISAAPIIASAIDAILHNRSLTVASRTVTPQGSQGDAGSAVGSRL